MIMLLQNRKYLGCSVHTHHIAIHPEIHKGIPGRKITMQCLRFVSSVHPKWSSDQVPCDKSSVILVDLSKENSGKEGG